MHEGQDEAP
jgi:hypothetical protein